MREEVLRVIDDILRPLIEADGGHIELVQLEGDSVVIRLTGACAGCPCAPYTTLRVIEPALKKVAGPNVRVRFERLPSRPAIAVGSQPEANKA